MCLLAVVDLLLPERGSQSPFQCPSSEKHQCLWCEALRMRNSQVEVDPKKAVSGDDRQLSASLDSRLLSSRALDFRYISAASRLGESAARRVLVLEW